MVVIDILIITIKTITDADDCASIIVVSDNKFLKLQTIWAAIPLLSL